MSKINYAAYLFIIGIFLFSGCLPNTVPFISTPTPTPSSTPTFTPTSTATQTPTLTLTPTITITPTPTATLYPHAGCENSKPYLMAWSTELNGMHFDAFLCPSGTLIGIFINQDFPEKITINQNGFGAEEYDWAVNIDVDANQNTGSLGYFDGIVGADYEIAFARWANGARKTLPFEQAFFQIDVWCETKDCQVYPYASRFIDLKNKILTLRGRIPGIGVQSRIVFSRYYLKRDNKLTYKTDWVSARLLPTYFAQLKAPTATIVPIVTQVSPTDGMTMVYVPEGEFRMGSENGSVGESPVHTVYLDGFWIDRTDVTNAMYEKCVGSGACQPQHKKSSSKQSSYFGNPKFDDYPVIQVDWYQADTYCKWAGRSLPTEAQWEKAARGTDERTYPWGEEIDRSKANYYDSEIDGNSSENGDVSKVGSYPMEASPYGALDMAGNVWQWVADWFGDYPSSPQNNPQGSSSSGQWGRVLRGGAWDNSADVVRSAFRNATNPTSYSYNLGFRCVLGVRP